VFAFTTTPITATTTIHARWFTSIIETVFVQGGSFMFGRDGATGGTLQTVGNFHIGKFPVTQGQWFAVMGNRPSFFTGTNAWWHGGQSISATPSFNRDNLPVERVSWYDVLVFANRLSERDGLEPAYSINGSTNPAAWGNVPTSSTAAWNNVTIVEGANGWRLPTEREWEFAAKGGTRSAGFTGTNSDTYFIFSGSDDADEVARYWGNSGGRTHPVGEKESNELGLYDMSGNVSEWVGDRWTPSVAYRVVRGGSWSHTAAGVRSVFRFFDNPTNRYLALGFRLVRP
jgi:formylglycine-generating enzyme required for sulfatase activity